MGFFRKLLGASSDRDLIRVDILMQYELRFGFGMAAVEWFDLSGGGQVIQAYLVALLYGRMLWAHNETKEDLFWRITDLATENVRTEGASGFDFTEWVLHVGLGGGDHTLWPWEIVAPKHITTPKTYSAILKHREPTSLAPLGLWIHVDMAWGQERILAPSSVLIAITAFSKSCDQETRYFLALLLWQMNTYWGSPDRVSACTESLALAAADSAIRTGELRLP